MAGKEIRIGIAGVGNCASSLIQGLTYYKNTNENSGNVPGLMHPSLGGYKIKDIVPVAAFDIDERKVGKPLNEAIFSLPNNTKIFCREIPELKVIVKKGQILDGFPEHMKDYPEEERFVVDRKQKEMSYEEVISELKKSGAEILINYLPVGSQRAVEFYAECALEAGVGFINCMPVFIASDKKWIKKFQKRNLPCLGDDIKSQLGATILHRVIARLASERGIKIDSTYQLNHGGNTDFLNMLAHERLKNKKISKTESVQSQLQERLEDDSIHIGPCEFIPSLKDNKVCYLNLKGRNFGDVPLEIDLKLSVEDSPNSAGCGIDAIRAVKLALDRKISGCLESASSYLMKHPYKQYSDSEARKRLEEFISGKRKRILSS